MVHDMAMPVQQIRSTNPEPTVRMGVALEHFEAPCSTGTSS